MQPLRYSINVTLDGRCDHLAITPGEEVHRHATSVLQRADSLLLGRITYQMMEEAWRAPAPGSLPASLAPFARTIDAAEKHVVSSTLGSVDWNAQLVRGDLAEAVEELKRQPGRGIYTGGVTLPQALAALGLIDEYEFVVHPRVAGGGRRLFDGLSKPLDLELVEREDIGAGAVAMRYVPRR
jgi:dihydrofolate reductase